jgi:hypothetical protein
LRKAVDAGLGLLIDAALEIVMADGEAIVEGS